MVEIHTGLYANASGGGVKDELQRVTEVAKMAGNLGLSINAGHGLNYLNVRGITSIAGIRGLYIGHSIISVQYWSYGEGGKRDEGNDRTFLMIAGIGTDIVEIERIRAAVNKWGDTFLNESSVNLRYPIVFPNAILPESLRALCGQRGSSKGIVGRHQRPEYLCP